MISSIANIWASLDPSDPNYDQDGGSTFSRYHYLMALSYARSKLCILMFAKELAFREKDNGVMVASVHPGLVRTQVRCDVSKIDEILNKLSWNIDSPDS